MSNQQDFLGKPCFFLYPSEEIKKNIVFEIFMKGYETYTIEESANLDSLFNSLHDFVLFVCINNKVDIDWIFIFDELKKITIKKNIRINFLIEEEIKKDFQALKSVDKDNIYEINNNFKNISSNIISYLETISAKGRRKYVRANCLNCTKSKKVAFKITIDANEYSGTINDISLAGMLASFDNKELWLEANHKVDKIELFLNGSTTIVSGKIFRDETGFDENLYVVLFDLDDMSDYDRQIISNFIFNCLQMYIERKVNNL